MPKDTNIAAQEKLAEGVNTGNFDVFDGVVIRNEVDHDPVPEQRSAQPCHDTTPHISGTI